MDFPFFVAVGLMRPMESRPKVQYANNFHAKHLNFTGSQPSGPPSTGNNGNGASSILGSATPFTVGLVIAFLPTLF